MTKHWRTKTETSRREKMQWPTLRQTLRQVALVLVACTLWSGLLVGCVNMSHNPSAQTQSESTDTLAAATTETPTPPPMATPTAIPSATAKPTATPEPSATPTDTLTPAPTPTDTSTPAPSPTETPLPPADTPPLVEQPAQVSFANDVLPILERRCLRCHGGNRVENDFSVQSYETVMKGSWNGAVVKPGDVDGSYLIDLIVSGEMPKRGPQLLPAEIEAITAWIKAGAPNN